MQVENKENIDKGFSKISHHYEQLELQLSREPRQLPKMMLNPEVTDIFDFKFDDFMYKN